MTEISDVCKECLRNYNKGVKMFISKPWTTNDIDTNEMTCPVCGHKEIIKKEVKK